MGRVEAWHQNLMSYGMMPWAIAVLWFFNRVGDRTMLLDWEYIQALFRAISPFYWASMGIYLAIGASITGAAWCVSSLLLHGLGRHPAHEKYRGLNVYLRCDCVFRLLALSEAPRFARLVHVKSPIESQLCKARWCRA